MPLRPGTALFSASLVRQQKMLDINEQLHMDTRDVYLVKRFPDRYNFRN